MTVLLGIRRARRDVAIGVEMPRRFEMRSILAIDLGVAVQVPHIGDTDRALGNEHPLVPVILDYLMWQAQWYDCPPS